MNNTKGIKTRAIKLTEEQRQQRDYQQELNKVLNSTYNKKTKEAILKYDKKMEVEEKSIETRRLYLWALNLLAECFPKKDIMKLDLTSDGDIGTFKLWLSKSRGKTSVFYILTYVKTFYKIYRDETQVKKDMKFVGTLKGKLDRRMKADEYATLEEVYQLVDGAGSKRNKAMIIIGWESALRAKSFTMVKLKDLQHITSADGKDAYRINVPVKNIKGKREQCKPFPILVHSVPYLLDWLEEHQFKDDPEAYLFYSTYSKSKCEKLSSKSLNALIQRVAVKIGFKKRVYWHGLRHWRTKWLIEQGYPEAIIKKMNGLSDKSAMLQVYSDFGEADVLKQVSLKEGLMQEEEQEKTFEPAICPRCRTANYHDAMFCKKCWMGLKPEAVNKIEADAVLDEGLIKVVREATEQYLKGKKT